MDPDMQMVAALVRSLRKDSPIGPIAFMVQHDRHELALVPRTSDLSEARWVALLRHAVQEVRAGRVIIAREAYTVMNIKAHEAQRVAEMVRGGARPHEIPGMVERVVLVLEATNDFQVWTAAVQHGQMGPWERADTKMALFGVDRNISGICPLAQAEAAAPEFDA